ncbi:hypothetical protein C8J31_11421 [Rhizobium sp. PP-CC-2G-626]|nr:hypothetical protein C8J31_11421 [Rhizobium sp. PP-CC-2G-626]
MTERALRHEPRQALSRAVAVRLPNLHFALGLYFLGMGILAIVLALQNG